MIDTDHPLLRDDYGRAKTGIMSGIMHTAEAVARILSDRLFVAECELAGYDKLATAKALVHQWMSDRLDRRAAA